MHGFNFTQRFSYRCFARSHINDRCESLQEYRTRATCPMHFCGPFTVSGNVSRGSTVTKFGECLRMVETLSESSVTVVEKAPGHQLELEKTGNRISFALQSDPWTSPALDVPVSPHHSKATHRVIHSRDIQQQLFNVTQRVATLTNFNRSFTSSRTSWQSPRICLSRF
ncbi:hypothetical protein FA15DRAFT_50144 [Coprinopsis marcescibilis]|uniref:Uncharacterized protein n=1 Tax=Coprinopsis marcescibilis TaxID=230819 RepID=A0A5C3KNP5_COPMA|nr:hypothetical protein FA15DRAFT_50144 [Coprinopsis marcescibilis]